MNYRKDRYGNELSILGYGCMRFSTKGGKIDLEKAEQEILAAFQAGVNYYDTAYIYSGSEAALGDFHPELTPVAGDVVVTKQYASAFFGSSLHLNVQPFASFSAIGAP